MNYSELEIFLKSETNEEKYILNSLSLFDSSFFTDEAIFQILQPIFYSKVENGILIMNDDKILPNKENIFISKHHRFIKIPQHKHNFIELIYVYSGSCTQTINGSTMTLKTGEVCILDTNVVHSIECASKNDIIINCLMRKNYFDTSFLSRLSSNDLISNFLVNAIYKSKNSNNYIIFHSGNNIKLMGLMQDLMCEYFDKSICSSEIINCYIILIFSELLKVYKNQRSNYTTIYNNKNLPNNIADVLKFIEDNYKEVTLTEVADTFHFHPNYISSLLKKTTGKSFKDIIHEQKLNTACSLLKNTDLTIEDISTKVGYNNLNFFYKKFKTTYNITPSEYRKLYYKFM